MKKKVIISVILIIVGILGGTLYGYLTNKISETPLEMKDPITISYYSDNNMSEKIDICIPSEFSNKLKVSSKTEDNTFIYTFRHQKSEEVLFMIYVYSNDANVEKINGEEIAKTEKYTYVWLQSLSDNNHIADKSIREEFNSIAKYYTTIKKAIKITKGVQ